MLPSQHGRAFREGEVLGHFARSANSMQPLTSLVPNFYLRPLHRRDAGRLSARHLRLLRQHAADRGASLQTDRASPNTLDHDMGVQQARSGRRPNELARRQPASVRRPLGSS